MGTNKPRTKQDNYTKATSQLMSERQLQDIGVLPGPKLKYHRCSSAIGEKEKRKSTNKHGEFKTHSWRAPTAQRARLKMRDSAPKTPTFRQAFALSSVSKILF